MNYILIVDDQADIRRLLSTTLGKQYEVLEADNGAAALFAVRRYSPKVVLLDVMLPGELNGLQVLDSIKSNPKSRTTLVAMVTARGQPSDSDEAERRGADAYFIKPFSPMQVAGWIRDQLEN
jgi:DNA-binding response OmpR family regulator